MPIFFSPQSFRQNNTHVNEANFAVRAEQLRARLHDYPLMMVASPAVIALLVVVILWPVIAHSTLIAWLSTMYAFHAMELYVWHRACDATKTLQECRLWHQRLMIFVGIDALVWGVAGVVLFVPDNLAYQALLSSVIIGVAGGAAMIHPLHTPSWRLALFCALFPLVVNNALVFDTTHLVVSIMLIMYFGYLLRGADGWSQLFELALIHNEENRQLAEQLTLEKRNAEQATAAKSRFLAAASHDLRQPMHALTLFVEALKNQRHEDDAQFLVDKISHSVEVLGEMFDALLDISKLDAGAVQPHFCAFNIGEVLQRMNLEFGVLANEKSLRLEIIPCDLSVYSDAALLERVFRNLIDNALRYTHHGQVSVGFQVQNDTLRFAVTDSGVGISPRHIEHIFEEYYQAGNAQRDRKQGLGLGLAIVKRLEQLLDLRLACESTEGVGSCFSFIVLLAVRAETGATFAASER
jgi:signal transduction histidine kinase